MMPDPAERFIAAAVSPLDDNAEMQIAAKRELQELISSSSDSEVGDLGRCAQKLEATPRGNPILLNFAVPVAVVFSLVVAALSGYDFFRNRHSIGYLAEIGLFSSHRIPTSVIAPKATSRDRLLLFGDPSEFEPSLRMKALWESDPDNPAYFAEYAILHAGDHRRLPPLFLETAARIDPDNGFFPMLAAAVMAKNCVEEVPPKTKKKKGEPPQVPGWNVKDPEAMGTILELLEKSAAMPKWDSYRQHLIRKRFALLPRPEDSLARLPSISYFASQPNIWGPFYSLATIFSARAEKCEEQGDAEGFQRLVATWQAAESRLLGEAPYTLMSCIIGRSFCASVLPNFQSAANTLRLEDASTAFAAKKDALDALRREKTERAEADSQEDRIRSRGSYFNGLSAITESFRPNGSRPITDEQLKPGRLADYALAERAGALLVWALFGIACFLSAIYRFRGGILCRKLSLRLTCLMEIKDWAWIVGGGIILPFAFLQFISRCTPLGGRDWSVASHGLLITTGQLLSTLLLMIGLPLVLARWRLSTRSGVIFRIPKNQKLSKFFISLALLAIPLFWLPLVIGRKEGLPWAGFFSDSGSFFRFDILDVREPARYPLFVPVGFVAMVACWLFGLGLRAIFCSRKKMLRRATLSRVLVPAYSVGMLLMALAAIAFHLVEKNWISHDLMMQTTTESVPVNLYENEVCEAYMKQLLEIVHEKP